MLASSAFFAQRVKTLTEASAFKMQILRDMERNKIYNSSSMRKT